MPETHAEDAEDAEQPSTGTDGRRRGGLLPVTAVGVASAGLTAVVGHHPWAHLTGSQAGGDASAALGSSLSLATEAGRVPGATALALVVLACWGVLLVTRGRVRRVVSWLGLLAALATTAAVITGLGAAGDDVRTTYARYGITDVHVARTVWWYAAVPIALVALAATVAAVRLVPTWPEMGRRYDAPTASPAPADPADPAATRPTPAAPDAPVGKDQDDLGVWKALSEGRDPTA